VGRERGDGYLGAVALIYIPEPSTLVLLAIGFAFGLTARCRRLTFRSHGSIDRNTVL